jgi:flagellar basal body rod protein FlgG
MFPYRRGVLGKQGGGVVVQGAGVDLTQATLLRTGNATDLALEGKGFFVVKGDQEGQPALTRDGRFLVNPQGNLVTANAGRPVLDAEGKEIKLDPALPVIVGANGRISQGDTNVQLKLQDVTDPRRVVKLGGNLMTVDDPKDLKDISPNTIVRSGHLEQSGVDPIVEMVQMMEGQRIFDANAKMISYHDQTLQQLNTIGRIA